MRMASFGVASFLIIWLVASCLSNTVAGGTDCAINVDCALPCRGRGGGICDLTTHKCVCNYGQELANVVPIVNAKCKLDPDCIKACPPGCKVHDCIKGVCFCEC
ncbi:hypothetical protein PTKIN_Ptkin02bG0031000 [Pterospermum kingtungense]